MAPNTLVITDHAIDRYCERVSPVTRDEARRLLSTPAVQLAASFGAEYVKLGSGQRIVIDNMMVVTVLPANTRQNKTGMRYQEPIE